MATLCEPMFAPTSTTVIPGRISKIPGVVATDTHIAFRAYSQHDLEEAFAIGLPDAD